MDRARPPRRFAWVLKTAIVLLAALETALLALFAAWAISGDQLGIARAMLIALALPYAVTTVPGMVLMTRGRLWGSFLLVALSVPLMWTVWFLA